MWLFWNSVIFFVRQYCSPATLFTLCYCSFVTLLVCRHCSSPKYYLLHRHCSRSILSSKKILFFVKKNERKNGKGICVSLCYYLMGFFLDLLRKSFCKNQPTCFKIDLLWFMHLMLLILTPKVFESLILVSCITWHLILKHFWRIFLFSTLCNCYCKIILIFGLMVMKTLIFKIFNWKICFTFLVYETTLSLFVSL